MKYKRDSVYPYSEAQLRKDFPNTSFPKVALSNPDIRRDYGVEEVKESTLNDKPGYKAFSTVAVGPGGGLVEEWEFVLKDVEELVSGDIKETNPPEQEGFYARLKEPELVNGEWLQTWELKEEHWIDSRAKAYGRPEEQIEFITENGLEAWQERVAEIKERFPKTDTPLSTTR